MDNGQPVNITASAEFVIPEKRLKAIISTNKIISGNSRYTLLHN